MFYQGIHLHCGYIAQAFDEYRFGELRSQGGGVGLILAASLVAGMQAAPAWIRANFLSKGGPSAGGCTTTDV